MKLQRSRFRLILLLLLGAFLAVLFFGSRQPGLLPELPSLPEIPASAVPESSVSPGPETSPSPGTDPSSAPADSTPAAETFDLYGL